MKVLPTPVVLATVLRYEADTGRLFWLLRPREMFPTEHHWKTWNSRFAGKEAFTALCNAKCQYRHGHVFGAADFFLECLNANAPRVAVENPVMHKWARRLVGRGPDFTVQPWQFGDDFTKRTCFWTRGLPSLRATSRLDGSTAEAAVHRAPPSETRKTDRARFHSGMAEAIADQWGGGVQFDLFGRVA